MEHFLKTALENNYITKKQEDMFYAFADILYQENKKYNLTGHKSLKLILEDLIISSIKPFIGNTDTHLIDVPRGTSIADLGSGAGIPGIPLAILFPLSSFSLYDSNNKKIMFIQYVIRSLQLNNIIVKHARIEELDMKNKFDLIVSRAMANIYIIGELAAPLLKMNGKLFYYSKSSFLEVTNNYKLHLKNLGFSSDINKKNNPHEGILLEKIIETEEKYPRRYAVIKRESEKV